MFLFKALRVSLVLVYFVLAAVVVIAISLLRPFNPDNTRLGGNIFAWGALKLMGIRYSVEGWENVANMKPSIVVANHQHNIDLFVCGPAVPKRTVSVGKKSLMYMPFFGQAYWLAGNIMIDRGDQGKSIDVLSQVTEAITRGDKSVWVFAEGTRNGGKGLLPFKKGAFHMALDAQVPIVPICVSTYAGRLDFTKWCSGEVKVKILPTIDTHDYDESNIEELMALTHQRMSDMIEELDKVVGS